MTLKLYDLARDQKEPYSILQLKDTLKEGEPMSASPLVRFMDAEYFRQLEARQGETLEDENEEEAGGERMDNDEPKISEGSG